MIIIFTYLSHVHGTGNLDERDIRIEDVLDLGEKKFNDVYCFMSSNTAANLVLFISCFYF